MTQPTSETPDAAPGSSRVDVAGLRAAAEAATPGPSRASVLGSEGYAVSGPQGSATRPEDRP